MIVKDPQLKESLEIIKIAIFNPIRNALAIVGAILVGGTILLQYNPGIAYAWIRIGTYLLFFYVIWVIIDSIVNFTGPALKRRRRK